MYWLQQIFEIGAVVASIEDSEEHLGSEKLFSDKSWTEKKTPCREGQGPRHTGTFQKEKNNSGLTFKIVIPVQFQETLKEDAIGSWQLVCAEGGFWTDKCECG